MGISRLGQSGMVEDQIWLPPGYEWRPGSEADHLQVRWWLQATLQEAFPQQQEWDHLGETIDRLFDPPRTPCWWIWSQGAERAAGCVWVGASIDQVTNDRIAYVFLLRVDPEHRRQGLGQALIRRVESWAQAQGLAGVLLQVFSHNQPALDLYSKAGFVTQGHWLQKSLR